MQKHAREHRQNGLSEGDSVLGEEQLLVRGDQPEACTPARGPCLGDSVTSWRKANHVHRNQQRIDECEPRPKDIHAKWDHRAALADFKLISDQ